MKTDRSIRLGKSLILSLCVTFCITFPSLALPDEVRNYQANPDAYEDDDTLNSANIILIDSREPDHHQISGYDWIQLHNFHDSGDKDWVMFYVVENEVYLIEVLSPGDRCNPVIGIYNSNGKLIIDEVNEFLVGEVESVYLGHLARGFYYVRIRQFDPDVYGEGTEYKLTLSNPYQIYNGFVFGEVTVTLCDKVIPAEYATLSTNYGGSAVTFLGDGAYYMPHISRTFDVTVRMDGCEHIVSVVVSQTVSTERNIINIPCCVEPPVPPFIKNVSGDQVLQPDETTAIFHAGNIIALNPINRVWAVIISPDYESGSHVPTVEFEGPDNEGVYTAVCDGFTKQGTYKISIYVKDSQDKYSIPIQTTVFKRGDTALKGDINWDGAVGLKDAMMVLKVLAGMNLSEHIRPDYAISGADTDRFGGSGLYSAKYLWFFTRPKMRYTRSMSSGHDPF